MPTIITYDIPSKHVEFKKIMLQSGYADKIVNQNRWIYLPNTTLYHPTKTPAQTLQDTQGTATRLNITLERCISTQFGPDWAAIWGEPFN